MSSERRRQTRGRGKGQAKSTKVSAHKRAGLAFPVGRIHTMLKDGDYNHRQSRYAAVYAAAVLEYLVAEVVEVAGAVAKDNKKLTIKPRHIRLAVGSDEELCQLFRGVLITEGGVMPHVEPALRKKKGKGKGKSIKKGSQEY